MHAPPQMLLSITRQRFRPLNGPAKAKKLVYSCLKCRSARPKFGSQLMAPLPASRVTENSPFRVIGMDLTANLIVKSTKRSNAVKRKVYVAVFICFVSKAVHLEMVENSTAKEFLKAFERFAASRRVPANVYTDNANTFVGANNELLALFQGPEVQVYASQNGIEWSFSPPDSPQHGGLWESAVRSYKSTLHKVNKAKVFLAQELANLGVKIEAALDSRPLTSLSSSLNDCEALTSGHFLIGRALMSLPKRTNSQHYSLYQMHSPHIMTSRPTLSHFWRRWTKDYLQSLQCFAKWHKITSDIEVGALVVV